METLYNAAVAYTEGLHEELIALIKTLCRIPAPSNLEAQRAAFCKKWFEAAGAKAVHVDSALNAIVSMNDTGSNDLIVFMAHTDTVFPDLEPFEAAEDGDRLCCPGVGDDTANLAMLMLCARHFIQAGIPEGTGVLFVANAGEEGLGNLKGCRQLMKDYAGRVKQVISFDGGLGHVVNKAVGSDRYQVKITAQGGHSYGKFGNTNAIHLLSCMVADLYAITPPVAEGGGSKTTYNVGLISGGTSVNTIAQTAEMLYEYRSDDQGCLDQMRAHFNTIVEKYKALAVAVDIELLGARPCMGDVDPAAQKALEGRIVAAIEKEAGIQGVAFGSGSTDCNIPYSLGIPGVCTGGYSGEGAHRREEWISMSSMKPGIRAIMGMVAGEIYR